MKKEYSIAACYVTVGEFKELIEDLPDNYIITCCGDINCYINVSHTEHAVTFDTTKEHVEDTCAAEEVICTYDDFEIVECGFRMFYRDDEGERDVELVNIVPVENHTEIELMDGYAQPFDVSGEFDNKPLYGYWRFID